MWLLKTNLKITLIKSCTEGVEQREEKQQWHLKIYKIWTLGKYGTDTKSTKKPLHAANELSTANNQTGCIKDSTHATFRMSVAVFWNTFPPVGSWSLPKLCDFLNVTVKKASGPDGLSEFVLKWCVEELKRAVSQRSVDCSGNVE